MRKFFFIATVMGFTLLANTVNARSWRINHDPEAKADFLSINDAMKSGKVLNGDVLYLDAGCYLDNQTISKKVTIIGTGYNLIEDVREARVNEFVISSDSVKLIGINVIGKILVNKSYITIERCKFFGIETAAYASGGDRRYLSLLNNFIKGNISGLDDKSFVNVLIKNNIVVGKLNYLYDGEISNNVIIYNATGTKAYYALSDCTNNTIKNNIIINTNTSTQETATDILTFYQYTILDNTSANGNNIFNNVLSTNEENKFADFPNNKFVGNIPLSDIFMMEGTDEEHYRLKPGSPAVGYGSGGTDCGAFGGNTPYIFNGRPRYMPYIYESVIPATPTDNKLNITLKIKTQND